MIRRPPRSTLFPTRRSSDLSQLPRETERASSMTRGSSGVQASWSNVNASPRSARSEEHTSELQSLTNLVCRLLLEKKKHRLRMAGIFIGQVTPYECPIDAEY